MKIEKLIKSIEGNNDSHNKYIESSTGNKIGPGCVYKAPSIKINYKTEYKPGIVQIKNVEIEYKESLFQETVRSKKVLEKPKTITKKTIEGIIAEISLYFERVSSEKSIFTYYLGVKLNDKSKLQELYETKALEHWVNEADYSKYCKKGILLKELFKKVFQNLSEDIIENYKKETKQTCDNKYFKEEMEFINALKHFEFIPQEIEYTDDLEKFETKTGLLLINWEDTFWIVPVAHILGLERLIIYDK